MQETQVRYLGGKVPWQRKRQSTPPFLPRKSHGQEPGGLQTTEPSPQTRTVHYTPQSAEPNPPPAPSYLTWSLVLKEDTDCSEAHKSGSSAFASSSEFVDCGNFDTQDTQDEEKCTFLYPGTKEEGGGRAGSCALHQHRVQKAHPDGHTAVPMQGFHLLHQHGHRGGQPTTSGWTPSLPQSSVRKGTAWQPGVITHGG